jgi:hypothetical protein
MVMGAMAAGPLDVEALTGRALAHTAKSYEVLEQGSIHEKRE